MIPNQGNNDLWKDLIILLEGGNVNAGTMNLIEGYKKVLYPIIMSDRESLASTKDAMYCDSLF